MRKRKKKNRENQEGKKRNKPKHTYAHNTGKKKREENKKERKTYNRSNVYGTNLGQGTSSCSPHFSLSPPFLIFSSASYPCTNPTQHNPTPSPLSYPSPPHATYPCLPYPVPTRLPGWDTTAPPRLKTKEKSVNTSFATKISFGGCWQKKKAAVKR